MSDDGNNNDDGEASREELERAMVSDVSSEDPREDGSEESETSTEE